MRRTPIRRTSKKRDAAMRERAKLRKILFAERGPICEAQIPASCIYEATDMHEVLTRARAGQSDQYLLDPQNVVLLCRPCHTYLTAEPAFATEHGFMVSWSINIDADLVAAARARQSFVWGPGTIHEKTDD